MAEPVGWDPPDAGRDLTARCAGLAVRLAEVLELSCSDGSGAPATAAFLREWAAATTAPPIPGPSSPEPPLDRLATAFALDPVERDLLVLAGLAEEHEGLADTFRALHPAALPRPSVGLAALVLGDGVHDLRPRLRRLLAEGALVRCGMVTLDGDGPLFERVLVVADALWPALHGDDAWPRRPHRVAVPAVPPGLDGWLTLLPVARAVAALRSRRPQVLVVSAPDAEVGLSRCAALAAAAGRPAVAARIGPDEPGAVPLALLHAAARDAVPVLLPARPRDGGAPPPPDLGGAPGPVLVCAVGGAAVDPGPRPVLPVPVGPIGPDARRTAWSAALPELAADAPDLAVRHPVDPALLAGVAADVRNRALLGADPAPGPAEITDVLRSRAGVVLPAGVDLRRPQAGWDRLVLPADPAEQLREAVARLDHAVPVLDGWGLAETARLRHGVRLLLSGPPGTGKSLAAEIVAGAAGCDLLVVDVSEVMSKWVGETEKNLAAIFDAAEQTQAVLLLDEADALFGARTAGSDAQDRYVNLHSAYLLQRLDRFTGMAVLTTNLRHTIDVAFVRRVDFVVEFPLPSRPERTRLWALHLPAADGAVATDVDVEVLAALYPVSGAAIRNAAVAAAFLAAAEATAIHRRHLVHAVRREYAKAAQPFPGEPQ